MNVHQEENSWEVVLPAMEVGEALLLTFGEDNERLLVAHEEKEEIPEYANKKVEEMIPEYYCCESKAKPDIMEYEYQKCNKKKKKKAEFMDF